MVTLLTQLKHNNMSKMKYLVLIMLLYISCTNKNKPYARYDVLVGDTVDIRVNVFDSLDQLTRIYHKKDSLLHGLDKEFYRNGRTKVEGNWYKGTRLGWFKYFDDKGRLKVLRQYLSINDPGNWSSNKAYLNQVIRFDEVGDTIETGSFFIRLYSSGDTILEGDSHSFKIILGTPVFKEMQIIICDFNARYELLPNATCDTFGVENYERAFSPKEYLIGQNYIRGKVVNFENYIDSVGQNKSRFGVIYFTHKFFVKQKPV